jgi:hypothetical protein
MPLVIGHKLLLKRYRDITGLAHLRATRDGGRDHVTLMRMPPMFQLLTDPTEAAAGYRDWIIALTSNAQKRSPGTWWLLGAQVLLKFEPIFLPGGPLPRRTSLAYDGTGESWTVEINPPSEPGNANSLSGVATDAQGRRWMLRQGFLRPNGGSVEIKGDHFSIGTGLMPVPVTVASGPTDREWYPVAMLDMSLAEICRQTLDFVARCAEARIQFGYQKADPSDTTVIQQLLGSPETGGLYVIPPKPPMPATMVEKIQGQVWEALADELKGVGKKLEKPRHAAGYEVDGVIDAAPKPLLIEIKSDVSAASVYAGVGQLMLYRQMIPSLAKHQRVLLLPGKPRQVLKDAVSKLDIIVESYDPDALKHGNVVFSPSFRALCGLS